MHPFLRLICYSCLVGAILFPADSIKAQSWEYALTEAEYEGSEFFDVLALDSQIIVAGARNSCHLPAFWVFDRQGNLLQFKDLTPELDSGFLYGYGKVMQLRYNDERKEIEAIGQVALADDVGGLAAFVWILDKDLNIIRTFDGSTLAEPIDQTIRKSGNEFHIHHLNEIWVLNEDFDILQYRNFEAIPWEQYDVLYHLDTLYVTQDHGELPFDTISMIGPSGNLLQRVRLTPFHDYLIFASSIITLGTDQVIRRYAKNDLTPVDSNVLIHHELQLDVHDDHTLSVIGYDPGQPATFYLLDSSLQILESFKSELQGEHRLKVQTDGIYTYALGSYYDVRGIYGSSWRGLVPFIRKVNLNDNGSIKRPSLAILDAEVLNVVEATDNCEILPLGDTLCFYGAGEPTYFRLTLQNTGNDTIWSLGYHSQIVGASNCARAYSYRFKDHIQILPGETVILQDSLYLSGPQFVDTMFFYVVGPNHRLHPEPNEFATLDLILSDQQVSEKTPLKIYPNPARDWIQLDYDTPPDQVRVINTLGQEFFKGILPSGTLDVSQWPSGQYFITASVRKYNYQGIFVKL